MRCRSLTKTHLFSTRINSINFHFIGIIELIVYLKILKLGFHLKKKEILQNENLIRELGKQSL